MRATLKHPEERHGVAHDHGPSWGIGLIFQRPRNDRASALRASIRVLVVDQDSPAVLAEVKALLGAATDMIVIGEGDSQTAFGLATKLKPDVTILDISMLGVSSVKVVERLRAACPASKILLHISPEDKGILRQLVELGVAGYLLKCSTPNELIAAIRAVAGDGFFFDPAV